LGDLLLGAVFFVLALIWTAIEMGLEHRHRKVRAKKVELAAEEAAEDDPAFAPAQVKAAAVELYREVQEAWSNRDRARLRQMLGADLMVEWERRLDDFDRKGWHDITKVLQEPKVQYLGLVNRAGEGHDEVVVRIYSYLHDVVVDAAGNTVKSVTKDPDSFVTEYWTIGRRDGHWILRSIEQDAEGLHHLNDAIVALPSEDDRLHDEAVTERATASAVATENIRQAATCVFDPSARAAALDLAQVDGRFAPDVLEAAAHRALEAWAEAVDGDHSALLAVATPEVAGELLHPGDRSAKTRLVVRGPRLRALLITAVDGTAQPPTMAIEVLASGCRYVEDRDTAAVLAGSQSEVADFSERWSMALGDDPETPWRIVHVDGDPVPGLAPAAPAVEASPQPGAPSDPQPGTQDDLVPSPERGFFRRNWLSLVFLFFGVVFFIGGVESMWNAHRYNRAPVCGKVITPACRRSAQLKVADVRRGSGYSAHKTTRVVTLVPDDPAGFLFPQVGYFDANRVTPAVVAPGQSVTAELWHDQVISITVRGHRYDSYAVEHGTWWLLPLGLVLAALGALTVRWRRLTHRSSH
jgi:predicted lipid-binding transport protein (Tim44 family)